MRQAIRISAWAAVLVVGGGVAWGESTAEADRLVGRAVAAEGRGDRVERDALLALALKRVPDHAGARGMMGQVFESGAWRRVEEVAGADRADYQAKRGKALETSASQAELARWCDANGLEAEAEAHRPWETWWLDQKGYALPEPTTVVRQESALFSAPSVPVYSCFAAGTLVRTSEGLRPIESLERGDKVLTADAKSQALLFRPILEVLRNPPGATLQLVIDGETIVATGYHRFRRAGGDWLMARDLRAGDTIRTVAGVATVAKITPGQVQPVFNLDVAGANSFFVGQNAALVHDNDLPEADPLP